MRALNADLLRTFEEVVRWISEEKDHSEVKKKVDHIELVLVNMHFLINSLRLAQARLDVASLVNEQTDELVANTERLKKRIHDLETCVDTIRDDKQRLLQSRDVSRGDELVSQILEDMNKSGTRGGDENAAAIAASRTAVFAEAAQLAVSALKTPSSDDAR